jgi:hypothetical protein
MDDLVNRWKKNEWATGGKWANAADYVGGKFGNRWGNLNHKWSDSASKFDGTNDLDIDAVPEISASDHYVNFLQNNTLPYNSIGKRRKFYIWVYEFLRSLGFECRWPLAAWMAVIGVHRLVDLEKALDFQKVIYRKLDKRISLMLEVGNFVIFEDVFGKLRKLYIDHKESPLKAEDAQEWDMLMLAEEQTLVQPLYSKLKNQDNAFLVLQGFAKQTRIDVKAANALFQIPSRKYNFGGKAPPYIGFLDVIEERWNYGMWLARFYNPLPHDFGARNWVFSNGIYIQANNGYPVYLGASNYVHAAIDSKDFKNLPVMPQPRNEYITTDKLIYLVSINNFRYPNNYYEI